MNDFVNRDTITTKTITTTATSATTIGKGYKSDNTHTLLTVATTSTVKL